MKEELAMRTKLLCLFVFLLANSVLAADPFGGTWKLNVGKSKPAPAPPGMAVKEETIVIEEITERYDVTVKGTQENGSAISARYSHPLKGGLVTYSGLPAGNSEMVVVNRTNDSTLEFIRSRDGKVVTTNHVTVSANGKMMLVDEKGVDAQGNPVHALYVFDKQ
jgi:hypothetical protein